MRLLFLAGLVVLSAQAIAQAVPAAIYTDPPADAAHPAGMAVLHIPSHGVRSTGSLHPAGPGLIRLWSCATGCPAMRRTLTWRRPCAAPDGMRSPSTIAAPGAVLASFRFAQNLEDADAVLAYLRDPANAAQVSVFDPKHIALAGHSMGGWVTAHTAAHDHALLGAILISAADMGALAERLPREDAWR